jgi:hypothetical protein
VPTIVVTGIGHHRTWIWIVRPIWTVTHAGVLTAFLFPVGPFVPRWTSHAAIASLVVLAFFPNSPMVIGRSAVLSYRISSWYERGASNVWLWWR